MQKPTSAADPRSAMALNLVIVTMDTHLASSVERARQRLYWKSNEIQLDSLKLTHPPLYEEVLNRFKTLKLQLTKETT
jgi:uncharacterized protein YlaN (UPF0358 family)